MKTGQQRQIRFEFTLRTSDVQLVTEARRGPGPRDLDRVAIGRNGRPDELDVAVHRSDEHDLPRDLGGERNPGRPQILDRELDVRVRRLHETSDTPPEVQLPPGNRAQRVHIGLDPGRRAPDNQRVVPGLNTRVRALGIERRQPIRVRDAAPGAGLDHTLPSLGQPEIRTERPLDQIGQLVVAKPAPPPGDVSRRPARRLGRPPGRPPGRPGPWCQGRGSGALVHRHAGASRQRRQHQHAHRPGHDPPPLDSMYTSNCCPMPGEPNSPPIT